MDQAECGGRDAGQATGLADGDGAHPLQNLAHLAGQAADGAVFDPLRNDHRLGGLELFDGFLLLIKVAGKLELGFDGARFIAQDGRERGGGDWALIRILRQHGG